jgi:hypothetical protein
LTALLVGQLLRYHGLRADALDIIKIAADSGDPESLRLQGKLYLEVGLLEQAREAYEQTLTPPIRGRDGALGQAESLALLSLVSRERGDDAGAAALRERAAVAYEALGLAQRAAALRREGRPMVPTVSPGRGAP